MTEKTLTVQEAAEALRIPQRTVYALIERGEIPAIRLGRRRYILQSVLSAILAQGRRSIIAEDDEI
jgi:excisionase family DNA binding protein